MLHKALLSLLLLAVTLWAGEISLRIESAKQRLPRASKDETKSLLQEFRNLYISAVVSENKADIVKSLNGIIRCQKRLGLDSTIYEKELKSRQKHSTKKTQKTPQKIASKVPSVQSVSQKDGYIIIKFNQPIKEKDIFKFKLHKNKRYKDVYDIRANLHRRKPTLTAKNLKAIRIAQNKVHKVRLVLENDTKINSKAFIKKGTLFIQTHQKKKTTTKTTTHKSIKKEIKHLPKKAQKAVVITSNKIESKGLHTNKKTIVIDAGHGGKDPGAVGYKKYKEKKTVLKIAKFLKKQLQAQGYQVYMTRDDDTFVELKDRTHFANTKKSDLFISLHANAAPKGSYLSLKGIETFFLSPAKTAKAKRVAAKENASVGKLNKNSKDTLLSFLNRNKIIQSNKLAIDIQSAMLHNTRRKFKNIKDSGVREAPFWVLVGAQMPAVLIELGYITNPTEGERLFNPFYQKALAQGICNGINNYFTHNR